MNNLKTDVYQKCLQSVAAMRANIEQTIAANRTALDSETKSSAGDKHETGRAMLQLEMEKAARQFEAIATMEELLKRIDPQKYTSRVSLGSIVRTSQGDYFIAVGLGEIHISRQSIFVISPQSPIGKLFMGKASGEAVQFNGKKIVIEEVI